MFLKLFLLFVFVPLADLLLLVAMSRFVGFIPTVLLVILSALAGAYFAKRSGMSVMGEIRRKMAARQMPTDSLADGAIVLFASALLLTPGLITDTLGMTMLIPYTRKFYRKALTAWFKKRFKFGSMVGGFGNQGDVVDSHVVQPEGEPKKEVDDTPRKVDPAKIELQIDD